ncbi:hypothetical protein CMO94_01805 [Candidatus Woesearchaeota archaeon]|nr:hypothetical protein [Candidatus Woesearchaeota archaeon]
MVMLNKKEIEKIIEFTKEGVSLNKIAKILRKSKTTVYYHFRKIKGKTYYPINLNLKDEELIGEFIGLFAGDGCQYKTKSYVYRTYLFFNTAERIYVMELKKVLYKLFNKQLSQINVKNVIALVYYSKNVYDFVRSYLKWDIHKRKSHSVRLKNCSDSKKFKIGFLRGCIDSDGYLSDKKINFATTSRKLAENIKNFLSDLNVNYHYHVYKEKRSNRVDIHHININMKERERFMKIISPREIKNLNASAGIRNSETKWKFGFPR